MGYTHYVDRQPNEVPVEEWKLFSDGCNRLFALAKARGIALAHEYDEPTSAPLADDSIVFFNGVADEGHETFVIERVDRSDFSFTKTARKPYDVVVTAALAYLDTILPTIFAVSSDGDAEDWEAGVELAAEAWPGVRINIPREVLSDGIGEE